MPVGEAEIRRAWDEPLGNVEEAPVDAWHRGVAWALHS